MTYTVHFRPRKDGKPFEISQRAVAGGDVSLDFSDKPVAERFNTAEEAKAAADEVLDRIKDVVDRITKVEVAGFKSVYRCRILGWALMLIGAVVFLAFVPCAIFLYYHHNDRPVLSLALGGAWTVGVPIYFYIEHEFFFFYFGDPAQYERFKRVQDLAAKIWAGAIAVLGAILAVKLA